VTGYRNTECESLALLKTHMRLDYGWWASNGPTAGYLMRLALDAIDDTPDRGAHAHRIDLHVFRPGAAAPFETALSANRSAPGHRVINVAFLQPDCFAVAAVTLGSEGGRSSPGELAPPSALPLEAYPPMATPAPSLPPVTSQFVYHPTTEPDGSGPRSGWDVVWVTPTDPQLSGRALVASIIDCWYPASFMRAVREHLRSRQPLEQPRTTTLLAASLSFTAATATYASARNALLANELSAIADGRYFERSEVWSDEGELLATAELLRRDEP